MTTPTPRYDNTYSAQHAPGRLVGLLVGQPQRGLVLDVGCGYAALADPLRDAGFEYVGLDMDALAVDSLKARGFAAEQIDLSSADVVDRLVTLAAGRTVAAITAIDVIEHLSPHQPLLDALAEAARQMGALVGLSIPNVTHVDLALKQLIGRWDVTEIGLLDSTHVSLFDDRRLRSSLAVAGLEVVAADDMPALFTEQTMPFDHPALRTDSPLGCFLRSVRDGADGYALTYQFVRLCRPVVPVAASTAAPEAHHMTPVELRFTVAVLAPDGSPDPAPLLAMIAAQTVVPAEVLLVGASGAPAASPPGVRRVAAATASVAGLLSAALAEASGSHLCVVLPGESVPPSWLQCFSDIAEGYAHRVLVHPSLSCRGGVEAEVAEWQPLRLLGLGGTPAGAFAVPLAGVRHLHLRPDDSHGEGAWRGFVVRAAAAAGTATLPATNGPVPLVTAHRHETASLLVAFGAEPFLLAQGWHVEAERLVHRAAQAEAITRSRSWQLFSRLRRSLGWLRRR